MKVKDMTFKEGMEFKIRVRPDDNCNSFAINIGHDSDNIALHFNPRFDSGGVQNIIVCNSLSGGCWGEEQHEGSFPLCVGRNARCFYINFNNDQFYIKLPNGIMMNFPNRLGDVKYKFIDVSGEARIVGMKLK